MLISQELNYLNRNDMRGKANHFITFVSDVDADFDYGIFFSHPKFDLDYLPLTKRRAKHNNGGLHGVYHSLALPIITMHLCSWLRK